MLKKIVLCASFILAVSIIVKETKPVIGDAIQGFAIGTACGFIPFFWPGAGMLLLITDSGTAAAEAAFYGACLGFVFGAIAFCAITGLVIYYLFNPKQNSVSYSSNSPDTNVYDNHWSKPTQRNLSWRQVRQNRLNAQLQNI